MTHKILSQGVLDGTCLIYSIMNAYKTLICPDISGIPTNYIDKIIDNQYKNTLITAFDILSGTENEFSVDRISIDEAAKT